MIVRGEVNLDRATTLFKKGIANKMVKPVVPEALLAAVHKATKDHVYKDPFAICRSEQRSEREGS